MRNALGTFILSGMLMMSTAEGSVNGDTSNQTNHKRSEDTKLLQRIDFGNAFVMGQTIKSGAVYLLKRKKSEIKSMIKSKENYREEILEDFLIQDMKEKD
jgi:hypothetical protein